MHGRPAGPPVLALVLLSCTPPLVDAPSPRLEIVIAEPRPGESVRSNPITVRGTARTFENNVVVRLRDAAGLLMVEDFTTARGDIGRHNAYEIDLYVTRDPGSRVTIEALEYSAKDGAETSLTHVAAPFEVELIDVTIFLHDPARAPNDCAVVFPQVVRVPKSIALARLLTEVVLARASAPRGARVRSVNLRDGILTVDFNERMQNVGGSCRARALRAALDKTLGALDSVRQVVITANGSRDLALQP